ncbi:threo-3-hydroxy-L-aspartate ammonia-lyase [Candidatus Acetothermia bacterium]|nr:threo-3-hydroxy-L-aspartate ammonia-lyase [Candidatus Acetothermia bacterium]MBI3643013.1 threo-3-hydroxy-L-aspartate ammonia-lyase [Candidatus Acetothermia bacterium]
MNKITEKPALVVYNDVEKAAKRLEGVAHCTPVMTSRTLNEITGNELFLKCENFQRMGAFKFRGAYNAMSQLSPQERARGVLTYSSGNHAQAIALSGKLLGVKTTIIMPDNAPAVKVAAVRGYGGNIILYDRTKQVREELGEEIRKERNLTLIPPFDHPNVVAGHGTAGKELFEEIPKLEMLLVPCGGGGLISGCSISAKHFNPNCRVIGVEPEAGDDGVRSFYSGKLESVHNPDTIADGARTHSLSDLTLSIMRRNVDEMRTVNDMDLIKTMKFLWERMKLIVEPTAALGLALLFNNHLDVKNKRVGVILSGGNVDLKRACELFAMLKE